MDQSQFELYKADFERVKSWDDIKQFVRKRNDHRYLAHKRCTRCEISGLMCTFHHLLDKDAFTVNCDAKDCYKSNGVCHGMEHGRIWPSHFVSSTPCDHCHHVGQLCRLQVPRKVLTGEINWRRSCAGSAKHLHMDRSTETDRCGHFPDKFHGDTPSRPSSIRRRLLLRKSNSLSRQCGVIQGSTDPYPRFSR
jgi:hypothetical protein